MYLGTVSVPNPTGSGVSTQEVYYGVDSKVLKLKDANGNTHNYVYDETNSKTTVTVQNGESTASISTYSYEKVGKISRLLGIADAQNHSSQITYDGRIQRFHTKSQTEMER